MFRHRTAFDDVMALHHAPKDRSSHRLRREEGAISGHESAVGKRTFEATAFGQAGIEFH